MIVQPKSYINISKLGSETSHGTLGLKTLNTMKYAMKYESWIFIG
jgi:hypothetical protein